MWNPQRVGKQLQYCKEIFSISSMLKVVFTEYMKPQWSDVLFRLWSLFCRILKLSKVAPVTESNIFGMCIRYIAPVRHHELSSFFSRVVIKVSITCTQKKILLKIASLNIPELLYLSIYRNSRSYVNQLKSSISFTLFFLVCS